MPWRFFYTRKEVFFMPTVICSNSNCLDRRSNGVCQANQIEIRHGKCSGSFDSKEGMRKDLPVNIERRHGAMTQKSGKVVR